MNPYFGKPWPSGYCDEPEAWQVPTPVGEKCSWCSVEIREGDQGIVMPLLLADGDSTSIPSHRECLLRSTVGGLDHLAGRCTCRGQDASHWPETPEEKRQEALQIWELFQSF